MPTSERREVAGGVDQLVAEACRTLARLPGPEARAARLGGSRREALRRLDMSDHETGERHRTRREQVGQPAEAGVQAIDKATQSAILIAERRSEAAKPRGGAGSQDRLLEPACKPAEGSRVEPAGGERMLQGGEQWHRGEAALGKLEDEAQEGAGGRAVQGHASRVVDLDAPAPQFGRNPARELAVGGDECGCRARRLELVAQQQ